MTCLTCSYQNEFAIGELLKNSSDASIHFPIYQGIFFIKVLFNTIIWVIFITLLEEVLLPSGINKKCYMLLGNQAKNIQTVH